jgi:hypothetical protein
MFCTVLAREIKYLVLPLTKKHQAVSTAEEGWNERSCEFNARRSGVQNGAVPLDTHRFCNRCFRNTMKSAQPLADSARTSAALCRERFPEFPMCNPPAAEQDETPTACAKRRGKRLPSFNLTAHIVSDDPLNAASAACASPFKSWE